MTIALASVGHDQLMRDGEIRGRSDPPRRRPNDDRDQGRDGGEEDSGAGAAHRPHARELGAAPCLQRSLRQMPDRLAAQGVSRLNAKALSAQKFASATRNKRPPADPARADDREKHESRRRMPYNSSNLEKTPPTHAVATERREAQDRRRQHDRRRPRDEELRQADLRQEAAGDREQRLLLRARGVVLGVSVARIDDRPRRSAARGAPLGFGARGDNGGRSHGVRRN